jgi:hypothetical protein
MGTGAMLSWPNSKSTGEGVPVLGRPGPLRATGRVVAPATPRMATALPAAAWTTLAVSTSLASSLAGVATSLAGGVAGLAAVASRSTLGSTRVGHRWA